MIAIIDYNAGNLTSVKRALDSLEIPCKITGIASEIESAERIIFPGVGHAAAAMKTIQDNGIDQALKSAYSKGTPILGICLGTQIILSHSEEGNTACLNLVPGSVKKFILSDPSLKVPHMGWNVLSILRPHPIFEGIQPDAEFYFVHSFYPLAQDSSDVYATCDYETVFTAALGRNNLFATQFHPEKSGRLGLRMLKNFSEWDGKTC